MTDWRVSGEANALPHRGLRRETAARWGYVVGEVDGTPCEVASYLDRHGTVVAQKVRFPGKRFQTRGDFSRARMYGAWLAGDRRDMLVVVEGEIDAMTVDQVVGVPAVSTRNGAGGIGPDLDAEAELWSRFERVVLMLDGDAPGRGAVARAMDRLDPRRTAEVRLPRKDANDMLVHNEAARLVELVRGAEPVGTWPPRHPRRWTPAELHHHVGRAGPAGWECVPHRDAAGHACFGPYAYDLPEGPARVEVDLGAPAPVAGAVAHVDVFDAARQRVLAEVAVRAARAKDTVTFEVEIPRHSVIEVRVYWHGRFPLVVGDVRLVPGR